MSRWIYFYALSCVMFMTMLYYKAYVVDLHGMYFLFVSIMTVMVLIGSFISSVNMYVKLVGMMDDSGWYENGKFKKCLFILLHSFVFALLLFGYPFISTIGILSILGSL